LITYRFANLKKIDRRQIF